MLIAAPIFTVGALVVAQETSKETEAARAVMPITREPRLSLEQAMKAALARVPGKVHEIDIVERPGDIDWLVEILTSDGRLVRVEVDRDTGAVALVAEPKREHIVGDEHKGKILYDKLCLICHGPQGRGDGPFGRHLFPPASDLTAQQTRMKADIDLFKVIQQGRSGTAMPAFGSRLSNHDIRHLLAYVTAFTEGQEKK